MKNCTRCGKEKPLSEFHKDATRPDGHCARCKACVCIEKRGEYAANPQKRQYQRDYYRRNRERIRAYQALYRAMHGESE